MNHNQYFQRSSRGAGYASLEEQARMIVEKNKGKWNAAENSGMCCCPAHNDKNPSLSVRVMDRAIVFNCFAGCASIDVVKAFSRLGHSQPMSDPNRVAAPPKRAPDLMFFAQKIWKDAAPFKDSLAQQYLQSRGIDGDHWPFRFDPRCMMGSKENRSYHPALIAALTDNDGRVTTVQRTMLSANGLAKAPIESPKRLLCKPLGGAVRIGSTPKDRLFLAEGIEDALSVIILQDFDHCWAVCGIERYGQIDIPQSIKTITIFSQHGVEPERAINRARKHLCANDRSIIVKMPPANYDWNDLLRKCRGVPRYD